MVGSQSPIKIEKVHNRDRITCDQFERQKERTLTRMDRSKKGSLDLEIRSVVILINKHPHFYTTSSCAGRIVLLRESKTGRKDGTSWLFVTHSEASFSLVKKTLAQPLEELVWLRMEAFIIHVCCRNLTAANALMNLLRSVGLKHSGILTTTRRIMIEVTGNEFLVLPVSYKNKMLVTPQYLAFVIREANRKLAHSRAVMQRFMDALSSMK